MVRTPGLRRVRRSRGGHRRPAPGAKRQGADGRRKWPARGPQGRLEDVWKVRQSGRSNVLRRLMRDIRLSRDVRQTMTRFAAGGLFGCPVTVATTVRYGLDLLDSAVNRSGMQRKMTAQDGAML